MKTEHAYTDAAQRREEEVREHISWFREFLTFGTELPETIRRQYGLEEDYRRYMELAESDNRMFEEADGTEYRRYMEKIRKGEIPGPGKAYGKVVLAVEKAYERICPSPARDYLEEKYRELLFLRGWCTGKTMMTRCGTSRKSLTNTALTTGLHAGRCWSRWKRHTGNWMPDSAG